MMNFRRPRNRFRPALAATGAALLLVSLGALSVPGVLRERLHEIARPLWQLRDGVSASVWQVAAGFADSRALVEENRRLRAQLDAYALERRVSRLLREENRELHALLGREEPPGVMARVLSRPPTTRYDTLIVDVGAREGVAVGDLVVYAGSVLGAVRSVTERTSIIVMYSSPGERTLVHVAGASTTPTVAEGMGAGNFRARVPRDVAVAEGAPVVLPHEPTLLLAEVSEVRSEAADSFRTLLFRLPLNVQLVRTLRILTDS